MIFNPKLNGFLSDQNSSILRVFLSGNLHNCQETQRKVKAKHLFTSSSMPSFSLSRRNWSRAYLTKYEYGIDLKKNSDWTSW